MVTGNLGGGTGNHFLDMVKHWDKRKWSTTIVTQVPTSSRVASDIEVLVFPKRRWHERLVIGHWRRFSYLRKLVLKTRPDVLHTYFYWPIMYGRWLKQLGDIRVLIENREDEGLGWNKLDYSLLRLTSSLPDRVICVSEAVRQVALEKEAVEPRRTTVLHNGVMPTQGTASSPSETRRELGIPEDALVVGMVANFNRPVKGVSYFIDAVPLILQAVPNSRFLILGRGKEEGALRTRAKALGVENCVIFAGFREDVDRYYEAMDVSALTSLSEGLSLTLLESMNHGLPVVVTRVGGNSEVVVHGETGFLVSPRDVPEFAAKVIQLLLDPRFRDRLGKAARTQIETHFQLSDVAARYLAIYETALRPVLEVGSK
jgi:glycosyltransferase involved in cell wall biosynthesis